MTIEEKIEEERANLPSEGLTPVTFESFMEWKRKKAERKQKELEDKMKEEAKKAGSKGGYGILSGRALFKYDASLFQDDEAAADSALYEERNEEDEIEEKKAEEESDNLRDGDGNENGEEESK